MDTWIWKLPKGILTTKSAKDFRKGHKERIRYISLFVDFVHTFVSLVVKFYLYDATPFEHRNDYTLINILTTKVAREFRKGRKGYIFCVLTLRSLRIPSCSLRLNLVAFGQDTFNPSLSGPMMIWSVLLIITIDSQFYPVAIKVILPEITCCCSPLGCQFF